MNADSPTLSECEEAFERLNAKHKLLQARETIVEKAYQDSLYQFYKTAFLRQHVANFMHDGTLPSNITDKHQLKLLDQQYQQNSTKPCYWFITVSVKPGVLLPDFRNYVEKFVKKKPHFYVYETRHEIDENLFEGLHCHMLVYSTVRPYDFKKSTKNTFKHVCDVNNPEIMNFKNISEELCNDKIQYMLGEKKASKQKGVKQTIIFRQRNNLDDFYESNPPLSCRVTQKLVEE